ncbi:MAG: carboxylate--amine ligase, partial [Spirochaetales bacterium]
MKTIFILGAGVMQGPAIRAAREKGYRVVVADADPMAAHATDADEFLAIDLKDRDGLLQAARNIPGLVGVFTAGTDFSTSVAWVASSLDLPGIPYEVAMDASDKARMRCRLAAAGVPVPHFVAGARGEDCVALAASLSPGGAPFPLVVKPVDNMGARGCRMARN